MKFKSVILTTCLTTAALFSPLAIHAQSAAPAPGAPPKFGGEEKPRGEGWGGKRDPEERIARLKEALALTPDQETKIRTLLKDEVEKMRADRKADKAENGDKPNPEARRAKMKAARDEMDTALKGILTSEQLAKYETMKKNRKDRGPETGGGAPIPKP